MIDVRVKFLITFALAVVGIPLVYYSCLLLLPLYSDLQALLKLSNLAVMILLVILVSLWIFALGKTVGSVLGFYKLSSSEKKNIEELKKKRESLELFKKVAVQEYYKKRITKETLDEILKIYGKEMVETKTRLKEIEKKKKK